MSLKERRYTLHPSVGPLSQLPVSRLPKCKAKGTSPTSALGGLAAPGLPFLPPPPGFRLLYLYQVPLCVSMSWWSTHLTAMWGLKLI